MSLSKLREMVKDREARYGRTGKPGLLQSMGLQRVGHNSVTKQQQQSIKQGLLWWPSG